jgi:acyl-CoA synthetase (NDP forming)
VALKVSSPDVQHKTAIGGLALDVRDEAGVRQAFQRLRGVIESRIPRLDNPTAAAGVVDGRISTISDPTAEAGAIDGPIRTISNPTADPDSLSAGVLVEAMAPPGTELIVSVRTDAVVPALTVGLGGIYVEAIDDVAIVPLPADEDRIAKALSTLRAPIPPQAAAIAAQIGAASDNLELLECNPVLIHRDGAVVVDAIAKEVAT